MAKFKLNEWIIEWLFQQDCFEFQWDKGNYSKSLDKHGITCQQAESVFVNLDNLKVLGIQISPDVNEVRYGAFGMSDDKQAVFVCFTLKGGACIRIILIRKINSKEEKIYERLCKK